MPGSQLLHYRLVRKIGEGGMGVVYEAEDIRLGRTVAIKLLQPSISENPEVKLRFLREARAASALDHPNLCTIYTVEEMPDGSFLLVMACYRGQTVAELLQTSGALDAARIRDIGRQTAAGLHAAHMAGIVHRDIKPGNIFLLHSGTVKILDFGLSHIVDQQQLTVPHQVMGTLAYMPPEQLAGLAIDHRADIWALGAVLYEMAAGHSPFHHPTPAATMSAITECRYIPLHQIRPELPKSIFLAVDRALCLGCRLPQCPGPGNCRERCRHRCFRQPGRAHGHVFFFRFQRVFSAHRADDPPLRHTLSPPWESTNSLIA
jgi:serine/threonine protein kinase